jgi:hypothetical protein
MNRKLIFLILGFFVWQTALSQGNEITVMKKRVSAAAWTPASIPNLKLWLDASDQTTTYKDSLMTRLATANADTVWGWADKSGSANHAKMSATVPVFLKKWTLNTNSQNGKCGVLSADTSGLWLQSTVTLAKDDTFLVVVVSNRPTNASWQMFVGGDAWASIWHETGDAYTLYTSAGVTIATTTGNNVSGIGLHGMGRYHNGADSIRFWYNGAIFTSKVEASDSPIAIRAINTRGTESHPTAYAASHPIYYEVLIYDPKPSDANITLLWAYLNTKWAVY